MNRTRSTLHALANLKDSSKGHKENFTKRLLLDEQGVHDETRPTLRSLQSSMMASDQLVHDFDSAHKDGEPLFQSFIKERMFSNVKN